MKEQPLEIPHRADPLGINLLRGMHNINRGKGFTIQDVLNYLFIQNVDSLASELPIAPLLKPHDGEVKALEAEISAEGPSFADIALAIRRRSSLQE
jgi:hypothetical protein